MRKLLIEEGDEESDGEEVVIVQGSTPPKT